MHLKENYFFLIKTGKDRAEVDEQTTQIPEYTGQKNKQWFTKTLHRT